MYVELDLLKSLPCCIWIGIGPSKGFLKTIHCENSSPYCSYVENWDTMKLFVTKSYIGPLDLQLKEDESMFNHKVSAAILKVKAPHDSKLKQAITQEDPSLHIAKKTWVLKVTPAMQDSLSTIIELFKMAIKQLTTTANNSNVGQT